MSRNIYLNKVPLAEAREEYLPRFEEYQTESVQVAVREAGGRVTAEAVYARRSAPHFYASAMDGIAVTASNTAGASARRPIKLTRPGEFVWVDTGDPIPENFNAVIKIEQVNKIDEDQVKIEKAVTPWQNVRSIGESVIKGQMIFPVNHKLTSYDLGALLEAGVTDLEVYKKPKLGIIPTGSEIVSPSRDLERGELPEFNSAIMKNDAEDWGAVAHTTEIIDDVYQDLKEKFLQEIKGNDITIIIAGSSAGREDLTLKLLEELGEVIVHGINIMPGKPLILAEVNQKPVLGIPGYPLSAWLDFHLFVKELVYGMQGLSAPPLRNLEAVNRRKITSHIGLKEYIRINLAWLDGKMVAVPRSRGSSAMDSLINADGILPVAQPREGLPSGTSSNVYIFKSKSQLQRNLLFIGSHDLSVDVLKNMISKNNRQFSLNIQSVGSMAGLMALKRQECHLAGAHLLDNKTGEYNISYIKKYLKDREIALLTLVHRKQGLMVKPGNPRSLESIEDLVEEDAVFINRQQGAGTRILLDYWLDKKEIDPEEITGYSREEYTHIGAGAAVANGSADTALGIRAAAEAMDLDFVPLVEERYDLIFPVKFLEDERFQEIKRIIKGQSFQKQVLALGGYRTEQTGQLEIVNGGRNGG